MRCVTGWLFCVAVLGGCASTPVPQDLFDDRLFGSPSQRIDAREVIAANDEMRRFIGTHITYTARKDYPQRALFEALRDHSALQLEYDAAVTRNAAEAFQARTGNCLSLVLMTAAFAKEMGLEAHFQSARIDDTWSRSGDLIVRSGHVNVSLSRPSLGRRIDDRSVQLVVDFLPAQARVGLRAEPLREETVIAMYMNNRAAEALMEERTDDGYAWAREAIRLDPGLYSAYNTLGLAYMRKGGLQQAERVYTHLLAVKPDYTPGLANLLRALQAQGRQSDAEAVAQRLAKLESVPPFHYFQLGQTALHGGDPVTARQLFARELVRNDNHEVHFGMALADWQLGRIDEARDHLKKAWDYSTTRRERDLYAAKLALIRRLQQPQP